MWRPDPTRRVQMLLAALWLIPLPLVAFVVESGADEDAPILQQRAASDHLPQMREEVRAILKARCSSCHDSTVSRENTAALEIFDLKHDGWSEGLSDSQLRKLIRRTESFGGTDRERARVRAFVEAELDTRRRRRSMATRHRR